MSQPADERIDVEALVEVVARLSPAQRRALQRRLHTAGLFVAEDLLTDKNPLRVAPAVRPGRAARAAPQSPAAPSAPAVPPPAPPATPSLPPMTVSRPGDKANPERLTLPLPAADRKAGGKAVLGVPRHVDVGEDPHTMPPLPGLAPDQPIAIVFDGGSRGNPGEGYGSYQVRWPGAQPQVVRLRFGGYMTNNEAEYDTLIGALEAVLKRLVDSGAAPNSARLDVRGDSLVVINQVMGAWKCNESALEKRRDHVRGLLKQFGDWQLAHHARENNAGQTGH